MEEKGLYVVNDKTDSWIGNKNNETANLDLMLASEEISDTIEYKQEKDTWGSNHFPIVFSMKFRSKRYRKLTNRISNYKTDWKKYKKDITNRDKELEKEEYSRGNIEIKYRYLSDSMREEVCKASEKKVKEKRRK